MAPPRKPRALRQPRALDAQASAQIREFLVDLASNGNKLFAYVNDRVAYLAKVPNDELSPEAKALLLDSDYERIQAVMSQASPPAVRWITIWIV